MRSRSTDGATVDSVVAERFASSALTSRLIIAVPGVIVAAAVVAIGGLAFAAVLAIIAVLGLYELYSLLAATRPLRWAGYLGALSLIGLAWALDDPEHGILLGLALSLGLRGRGGPDPRPPRRHHGAGLDDAARGGLSRAAAGAAGEPAGAAPRRRGHRLRAGGRLDLRHGLVRGRPHVGPAPDRAPHVSQEDRRGGHRRPRGGDLRRVGRGPLHGLDQRLAVAGARPGHLPRRRSWATSSSR